MGILQRLFGKKNSEATEHASTKSAQTESEWEKLEAFVPVEAEEARHVSIIAAAIAASDYPESQFVVKRVLKRNPETKIISVIASAIAAGESNDSQWAVKEIYQKRNS